MAFTREQLLWLIDNKCGGDWRRIHSFLTDNHPPIFLHQYNVPGKKGIEFVDQEIGNGEYITGFFLYGGLSIGNRSDDNDRKAEYFLGVSDMMGIGFDTNEVPEYAKESLYAPAWDEDIVDPQISSTPSDTSIALSWPSATSEYWDFAGYHIYQGSETKPMALVTDGTTYVVEGLKPERTYSFTVKAVDKRGNASIPLQTSVETTPDSTPPVWEDGASLVRTNKTMQSISIKWPNATDNIRVSGYNVYIDSTLHVQLPYDRLSYIVGGLSPGTSYLLSVRATDAKGNESLPLELTDSTLGDNVDPFWQTGSVIEFSNVDNTSITLSWPEATDNVGVDKYHVYLTVDGTSSLLTSVESNTLSYVADNLEPGTEYSFEVVAVDESDNRSSPLTGAMTTPADSSAPEWNSGATLSFTDISGTSLTINWPEANDVVGVSEYRLYEIVSGEPTLLETFGPESLSHHIDSLNYNTEYSYGVIAVDADENESIMLQGTQSTANDTTPPEWNSGAVLTFTDISEFSITVNWPEATDIHEDGVVGYEVYVNNSDTPINTVNGQIFSQVVSDLELQTLYTFTIVPIDSSGNKGVGLTGSQSTTADTTNPQWPAGSEVTFSNITDGSVTVSWTPATDNVGVTGYQIYMSNTGAGYSLIGEVDGSTLSYEATDLTPSASYLFRIRSKDAAGNGSISLQSDEVFTLEDATRPTWEEGQSLTFTDVSQTAITLNWPEATDNVGVVDYRIYMGTNGATWTPVEDIDASTLSYQITDLEPGTGYHFRVRALDEVGNLSSIEESLDGMMSTLDDTQSPTWGDGASLTFSGVTGSAITVSWPSATDDFGLRHYELLMDSGSGYTQVDTFPSNVNSHELTGLASDTEYSFRVIAHDEFGNQSVGLDGVQSTPDVTPPTWDAGASLTFSNVGDIAMTVNWPEANDLNEDGVVSYEIYVDGSQTPHDTVDGQTLSYTLQDLTPETEYSFTIIPVDSSGNKGSGLSGSETTVEPFLDGQSDIDTNHELNTEQEFDTDEEASQFIKHVLGIDPEETSS